jgi:hypothetical protein
LRSVRATWLVVLLACLAVPGAVARTPQAGPCGIPTTLPLWIDYAGHGSVIPAKPGIIAAVSSGTDSPTQMRAQGAATIFFDLNLNNRIGTPTNPADPGTIADLAQREYAYAVSITGCQTPIIAENELFGAGTSTPWSDTNAQYRENALALLQHLAALGAQPALELANPPYVDGAAADWWRSVAKVAILVHQVYFSSKSLYAMGPVRASRGMRGGLRSLVARFSAIGIPASRVALELQFQSALGTSGREGLQPASAWFEIVKLETLAAKEVANEFKIEGVWSWGWATFSVAGSDPDKPAAACVWLWASRGRQLCDGPKYAGPGFDTSLTEGQLILPAGARCVLPNKQVIDRDPLTRLTALAGDPGFAASVLLERAVLHDQQPVSVASTQSAERSVIAARFGGSHTRYLAALSAARLTTADAEAMIADRLARDDLESRFHPQSPPEQAVRDFLSTYAGQTARLVQTTRPAPWLDGGSRGWVIASLGPAQVFTQTGATNIDTADGPFLVTPISPPVPLAILPPSQATSAARQALDRFARAEAYGNWLRSKESTQLAGALCLGDNLPTPGPTDLSAFAPFLLPS